MNSELISATVRALASEPIAVHPRIARRLHIFCALAGADIDDVVTDLLGAVSKQLLDDSDKFSVESAEAYGSPIESTEWSNRLRVARQAVGL